LNNFLIKIKYRELIYYILLLNHNYSILLIYQYMF